MGAPHPDLHSTHGHTTPLCACCSPARCGRRCRLCPAGGGVGALRQAAFAAGGWGKAMKVREGGGERRPSKVGRRPRALQAALHGLCRRAPCCQVQAARSAAAPSCVQTRPAAATANRSSAAECIVDMPLHRCSTGRSISVREGHIGWAGVHGPHPLRRGVRRHAGAPAPKHPFQHRDRHCALTIIICDVWRAAGRAATSRGSGGARCGPAARGAGRGRSDAGQVRPCRRSAAL